MCQELLRCGLLSDSLFKHVLIAVTNFLDHALRRVKEPFSCAHPHEVITLTSFDSVGVLLLELVELLNSLVAGLDTLAGGP